jgi:TonB family protein
MFGEFCVLRQKLAFTAFLLLLSAPEARAQAAQEPPATPAAEAASPLQVGAGVSRPEKISGATPLYTEIARKAGVQGTVVVESIIDKQGNITEARILRGLPLGLGESALDAVKTWKFKPAIFEGQPVKVYYTLSVNFSAQVVQSYGPLFRKFLEENVDFTKALATERYQDAAQLLDHRAAEQPAASEVPLARCYLLLEQGRFQEAWQEAQSYRGPDPFELPYAVGSFTARRVAADTVSSPEARAEMIELGLQAETQAMAVKTEAMVPILYKVQLLREKEKLASDPQQREALAVEADLLLERVKQLYAQGQPRNPFAAPAGKDPG